MGNLLSGQQGPTRPSDPGEALRFEANLLAQQRNEAFQQSRACYDKGDHAGAKRFSQQGKQFDRELKAKNAQAAQFFFDRNNKGRWEAGEVDLHGLFVEEAVQRAEQALERAKTEGRKKLVFIVGRGLHSPDGVSRLRPAVVRLADKHSLRCTPGTPNQGCITVEFVAEQDKGWFGGWGCVIC